ncbi:hypothetical protein GCM10011326_44830 [Salipiger profundus]|nr:hypothetical protein GCM10011326_44830 [Salipiger profundus]
MALFGLLHVFWLPFVETASIVERTFVLRLNVVVMAICFQIILSFVVDYRAILKSVQLIVWGTALLNVFVVVMPQIFSVQMGSIQGRASGLYGNPNLCATFMAMLLPLMTFGKTLQVRFVHYIVVLIGIFFTFSRGGAVIWAVSVFLDLTFRPGAQGIRPKSIATNVLLSVLFSLLLLILVAVTWFDILDIVNPYLNADTIARLNGTDQGSGSERLFVLALGYEAFTQNPFFGGGFAATRNWGFEVSVHNMYILILAEFGVIGGLWYIDFLRRIFKFPGRFGIVLGTLMAIESVFTHSYFDLAHYMLLVMLYWRLSNIIKCEQANPPSNIKFKPEV